MVEPFIMFCLIIISLALALCMNKIRKHNLRIHQLELDKLSKEQMDIWGGT